METQMISLRRKVIDKRLEEIKKMNFSSMNDEEHGFWRGVESVFGWLQNLPTFDQIS